MLNVKLNNNKSIFILGGDWNARIKTLVGDRIVYKNGKKLIELIDTLKLIITNNKDCY